MDTLPLPPQGPAGAAPAQPSLSFEQAMERLEKIVRRMEQGDAPLDELMKCFEEGKRLVEACESKLGEFERKIQILVKDDGADGEWRDFERPAAP